MSRKEKKGFGGQEGWRRSKEGHGMGFFIENGIAMGARTFE